MAAATIDAYLDGVAPLVQPVARMLRTLIESELPGTPSKMHQGIPARRTRRTSPCRSSGVSTSSTRPGR